MYASHANHYHSQSFVRRSLDGFQQLLSESTTSEVALKAIVTLPAEPKVRPVNEAQKKSVDPRLHKIGAAPPVVRAAEAKEAKGNSDSQPKDRGRGQEVEKAVSQVKGIYRDEDGNLVASVKHIRPSQDSKGYNREDADSDTEWEASAMGGALLAWNHITAVNIAEKEADEEEEEEETVEEEDALHVTCMPTEALMRSKVSVHHISHSYVRIFFKYSLRDIILIVMGTVTLRRYPFSVILCR